MRQYEETLDCFEDSLDERDIFVSSSTHRVMGLEHKFFPQGQGTLEEWGLRFFLGGT